jgi:hypothetical protein
MIIYGRNPWKYCLAREAPLMIIYDGQVIIYGRNPGKTASPL